MKTSFLAVVLVGLLAQTLSGQTPVSLGQPVTASSFQTGNDPSHGNDGDPSTRWAAADATYPQWWRVDLGSAQTISKAVINWYNSGSRAYQYRIETSNDDATYSVLVDNSSNGTFGDTTDNFLVAARYVRIYVTGATSGWAGFYECSIYLAGAPQPSPTNSGMFCELLEHPEETVITALTPHFGWVYNPSFTNDSQSGYRIIVASTAALAGAGTGDLWDSGLVSSGTSLNVPYAGASLQPNTSYFWRVQTRDSTGQLGPWSGIQQFNTAGQLSNPLTTAGVIYKQPSAGSANCYPLRYVTVAPVVVTTNSLGHWFIDFGKDAFGYATVHVNGNYTGTNVGFGLGELAANNIVNTSPGATIRYRSGSFTLQNGDLIYSNRSTISVGGISPPTATYGLVSPFRYLELSGLPAGVRLTANDVTQQRLQTEFDDTAATFNSSNPALNQVWALCQYSMKALSFDGIYVDGDRERTPYEADSYIHQMSSYGVNNDFTTPRCSFEYLTNHLTWPTEWPLHMVFIAWADYQQTGDPYLMTKYYGFLTNSCMLLNRAGRDGLVQSYPVSGNTASGDVIDWYRIGNTDGYAPEATNAVINAFYYRCLTIMSNVAQLTGHAADAASFGARAAQVYSNYDRAFWSPGTQSYIDGEGTNNSSAPANYFPLAFGLVPANKQAAVINYIHGRITANGGMPPGVYGAQYLLEALFLAGDADTALGLMTTNSARSWLNMLNIGSTITDEAWSVANKANEDWNHAWGAAPGNLIPRYILGLRPLSAGYGQVLIQPQLGQSLSYVQGTIPTIRGLFSIQATNAPGQFQLLLNLPGNVMATVMLPTQGLTNPAVAVNGSVVPASITNGWLTITNLGGGQQNIRLGAANTFPPTIGWSRSGGAISLSWLPQGWLAQSNTTLLQDTNGWHDIPGSQLSTSLSVTADAARSNVFYRLRYPTP